MKVVGTSGAKLSKADKIVELCLGIFFIILSLMVITPILNVVATSFSSKSAILSGQVGILPVDFTLEAYEQALTPSFLNTFMYSILLMLGSTTLSMICTMLCAYPLSRPQLKGAGVIMTGIIITMYLNPGIIPNYMVMRELNLLNSVWVLILPGLISAYNMIIMRTFFKSIDNALYEASYLDGASELQTLIRVILPLTTPVIATLSLFYAVSRWNGVTDILYYITDPNLYTVQMKLKQILDAATNVDPAEDPLAAMMLTPENIKSATIVISMLPMLVVYPFVQKYFTKGIMLGSVKG